MNILIIQPEPEQLTHTVQGGTTVDIVDPSNRDAVLDNDYDFVAVSKKLPVELQASCLKFAYKLVGYSHGNLSKVRLL